MKIVAAHSMQALHTLPHAMVAKYKSQVAQNSNNFNKQKQNE